MTSCPRRVRVPRTRGDGPCAALPTTGAVVGSPHTRGWTASSAGGTSPQEGFPAHAGMDPLQARLKGPTDGVPRTRGDGPHGSSRMPRTDSGSPHTRGWTPEGAGSGAPPRGFPAHAGMDRISSSASTRAIRVPRTRGDGPPEDRRSAAGRRGSPHTRGWTQAAALPGDDVEGFPAHAGMDRRGVLAVGAALRVPRTRGDGPHGQSVDPEITTGSPHTRGWTAVVRTGGDTWVGFPAHAGMDPRRGSTP